MDNVGVQNVKIKIVVEDSFLRRSIKTGTMPVPVFLYLLQIFIGYGDSEISFDEALTDQCIYNSVYAMLTTAEPGTTDNLDQR